ncbi:hypothetical protein [Bifidobacterium goeldii]|nr:hypothetical protein [Bifidobacterium goeldii]
MTTTPYTALDFAEAYLLRGGTPSSSNAYDVSADENTDSIRETFA